MLTNTGTTRRRARGISTLEVMAGITVGMITALAVYSTQDAQLKAVAAQGVFSESQAVTRSVIDIMSRELRMAVYDPRSALVIAPANGCAPNSHRGIVAATPTSIRFQQDLNNDGFFNATGEDVRYQLANNTITRTDLGVGGQPIVMAENVQSFTLTYFDASSPNPVQLVPAGSPAALTQCQRDLLAKVRVTVAATILNSQTHHGLDSTAESLVAIRNRSLMNI